MGLMDWASGVRANPGVGAGLLGGDWAADPTKNDAIRKALMAAGFGMLSNVGRGNFAQGLGQAGMAGMGAYEQTLEDKRRQDMQAFQFDQAKQQAEQQRQVLARQQRLDALPAQFMRPGGDMAVDATGGMETAVDAPQNVARPAGFDTPGYIQALMGIDPVQAIRLQEMTKQATPAPIKLGQGDQLLDPTTFKPLATNPKDTPEKTPEALRALSLIYGEGSPEYRRAAQDYARKLTTHAPPSNTNVTVPVNAAPKAFWSDVGKGYADTLFKERESAQAASGTIQAVREIRKAAEGGAYQGAGAEIKLGAAKALGALGMPYDAKTVANSEVFDAQAKQFVLNQIKALGANPSNTDREFIEKTVPRLGTDPAALPALLNFLERRATMQIDSFNRKAREVQQDPAAQSMPFKLEVTPPPSNDGWSITPIPGGR